MPGDPKECRQQALACVRPAPTSASPQLREQFAEPECGSYVKVLTEDEACRIASNIAKLPCEASASADDEMSPVTPAFVPLIAEGLIIRSSLSDGAPTRTIAQAWQAANDKARELGLMISLSSDLSKRATLDFWEAVSGGAVAAPAQSTAAGSGVPAGNRRRSLPCGYHHHCW
jgi:hypothetical protein